MRRADRLFRIVERLKARKSVARAEDLAQELEVSVRTIYRDIADLMASGTPIHGEAGVGYVLDRHHVIRPLMFSAEELDTLMLGARMLESWGDKGMSRAGRAALDKIRAVAPRELVEAEEVLFSFPSRGKPQTKVELSPLRAAIRAKRIVTFSYESEAGARSTRSVRPLSLVFFAPIWIVLGWCEMRSDFRNFRIDRMSGLVVTDARFRDERGKRLKDYFATHPEEKAPNWG
jgi:predicted DNA-binding transcriptional regulator YafY